MPLQKWCYSCGRNQGDREFRSDFENQHIAYKQWRGIEGLFAKLNLCRQIATRYDKLPANFLDFIKLANTMIWLKYLNRHYRLGRVIAKHVIQSICFSCQILGSFVPPGIDRCCAYRRPCRKP